MLVSAIMPTRGRPAMSQAALVCFLRQTYEPRELVIVDDPDDPSFAVPPAAGTPEAFVAYARARCRALGAKRNLACELASGDVIAHFDSDDFYAPGRLADQVTRLEQSGKAVTSYRNIRFTDGERWWLNTNWPGGYGATLCYRRDWWEQHRFPDLQEGEDWHFVSQAMRANEFVAGEAGDWMHATVHPGNTSPRVIGEGWIPIAAPGSPESKA